MPYEIEHEDMGFLVTFRGTMNADEAISATVAAADLDPSHESSYMIVDARLVERMDFEVPDLHRLAVSLRVRSKRGGGFRVAFVVASPSAGALVELFGDVRRLLTGQPESDLSQLGVFEDFDAARAWATIGSGGGPG